jgi:glyoxylase-like metal-dependent hydrolase (beta-lactamase superfamily II)
MIRALASVAALALFAIVLFHNEKIAFVGDLAFSGRDPLIHREKGGTSIGYIEALKRMIALPADLYLSGHADPMTKDDLRLLLQSMEDKLAKVKELVAQGKSLDEVKAALGVQTPAGSPWPSLVEVMYLDLTEKGSPGHREGRENAFGRVPNPSFANGRGAEGRVERGGGRNQRNSGEMTLVRPGRF